MTLELRLPGVQATIQDGGRPGFGHLGVPRGGAVDTRGLAIANLLIRNESDAATVELAIGGAELRVLKAVVVGLGGADLDARVLPLGRRLEPNASYRLAADEILHFGGPVSPRGVRAYVAVPGGVDAPVVLGSRSTCLAGRFGGIDGRQLRTGDRIVVSDRSRTLEPATWPRPARHRARTRPDAGEPVTVRFIASDHVPRHSIDALTTTSWSVSPHSDRMGLRLSGTQLGGDAGGPVLSHGVTWGTIQVPPDGQPIVLLADHQPTGGYPVAGVVITADLWLLGQLGATAELRFQEVSLAAAIAALRQDRVAFGAERAAFEAGQATLETPRSVADGIR